MPSDSSVAQTATELLRERGPGGRGPFRPLQRRRGARPARRPRRRGHAPRDALDGRPQQGHRSARATTEKQNKIEAIELEALEALRTSIASGHAGAGRVASLADRRPDQVGAGQRPQPGARSSCKVYKTSPDLHVDAASGTLRHLRSGISPFKTRRSPIQSVTAGPTSAKTPPSAQPGWRPRRAPLALQASSRHGRRSTHRYRHKATLSFSNSRLFPEVCEFGRVILTMTFHRSSPQLVVFDCRARVS